MDRFFKAYDECLRLQGHRVTWIFSGGQNFSFYSELEIRLAQAELQAEVFEFLHSGEEPEIIVTHFVDLCTKFYKELKKRSNAYCIAVDHNPRPLKGYSLRKKVKKRIRGILFSRYIDLFVGVSNYTQNCIIDDFGAPLRKKTVIVYNGVETEIYKKRTAPNKGRFIVASHLRPSKGIQDLIEALKALPEEIKKEIEIDIYGEGPLEKDLKLMMKNNCLEEQLNFRGSSSDLPQLFSGYSYLLQPTYMECFSLSILESLAANVPVITTPVGGNPEIIKDGVNGFLCPPGDVDSLSEVLKNVMQGEMEISGRVDREIEENYNLQRMVEGHINLLPCI